MSSSSMAGPFQPIHSSLRLVLSLVVVAAFLLSILTTAVVHQTAILTAFPDFSHYKFLQTLSDAHVPVHPHDSGRIIAVGDIHGMNDSLSALLHKIAYDPRSDTLIHLGDLVPKGGKVHSDPVLTFMATNNILGVRGNNDQKVIEWRAWMDWIITLPGGKKWLKDLNALWSHIDGDEPNPAFDAWLKKSHPKWKAYVPKGWKLQGKHFKTAHQMSEDHYDYLLSLPLVLYAPAAHTYLVHAGLLPADPTRKTTHPKQPLSHWPTKAKPKHDPAVLRGLQELALLNEIPQNQDPWVLTNMRSLSKKGKVKEGKEGTPWSDLWNDVMDSCSGYQDSSMTRAHLPCFPSMVMYGHAAARDLDVKRWSVGIDTGCTYGRRLTAVVLDNKSFAAQTLSDDLDASSQDGPIPYGDNGTAHIVSVKCHV